MVVLENRLLIFMIICIDTLVTARRHGDRVHGFDGKKVTQILVKKNQHDEHDHDDHKNEHNNKLQVSSNVL